MELSGSGVSFDTGDEYGTWVGGDFAYSKGKYKKQNELQKKNMLNVRYL